MSIRILLLTGVCALLSSACATPSFEVRVNHYGTVDPARDRRVAEAAQDLPWDEEYAVTVVQGKLPEGLTLKGRTLEIAAPYKGRYEVIGELRSQHRMNPTASYALSTWWFIDMHDQHSGFRNVFCKAQMPLRLLTLGIWSLFSPLSWPCQVVYSLDHDDNFAIHVQELKRAATAMGANLIVLTRVSNERTTQLSIGYGYVSAQSYNTEAARVSAFALIDKDKPLPTPPPPD